jgi:hypothetical protein
MIGKSIQLSGSQTKSLNVKINPELTGWVISPNVSMSYVVHELGEINGVVGRKYISEGVVNVEGRVINNEFNITLNEVQGYLVNNIPKIIGKTQIDLVFILTANKLQEQPVVQQFLFKDYYTLPSQSQVPVANIPVSQTALTFPPQKISINTIGESQTLGENGLNGLSYYNIKKPAGGYITLQLSTENPFDSEKVVSYEILNAVTYDVVTSTLSKGETTSYTNVIETNNLGAFRLRVTYRTYGFTAPINGEVLIQSILSDVFTL